MAVVMNPAGSSVLLLPGPPDSLVGLNHMSEVLVNASELIIIQFLPVVGRLRPRKQAQCGQMKSCSDCKPTAAAARTSADGG